MRPKFDRPIAFVKGQIGCRQPVGIGHEEPHVFGRDFAQQLCRFALDDEDFVEVTILKLGERGFPTPQLKRHPTRDVHLSDVAVRLDEEEPLASTGVDPIAQDEVAGAQAPLDHFGFGLLSETLCHPSRLISLAALSFGFGSFTLLFLLSLSRALLLFALRLQLAIELSLALLVNEALGQQLVPQR